MFSGDDLVVTVPNTHEQRRSPKPRVVGFNPVVCTSFQTACEMNAFLGAAQAYFEVFLEAKMDAYGAAVLSLPDPAAAAAASAVSERLAAVPATFLDDVDERVQRAYHALPSCFALEDETGVDTDAATSGASDDGGSLLYGELTPLGVRQLQKMLLLPGCSDGDAAASVFCDLGSGTGKVVAELAILCGCGRERRCAAATGSTAPTIADASAVQRDRFVGVELSFERHETAVRAKAALFGGVAGDANASRMEVRFVCGSFLDPEIIGDEFLDATAVFCCGVGFGEPFVRRILDVLDSLPQLRTAVLLVRAVPRREDGSEHPLFTRFAAEAGRISTSWMSEAPAIVLRRRS